MRSRLMFRHGATSTRGLPLIAVTLVIVTAFAVALTVLAAIDDRLPGELRMVREVQGWSFPGERLSRVVRRLTTTGLIIVLGVLLALGLFARGRRQDAVALLLLMAVLPLLQSGLKNLVDRARPTPEIVDVRGDVTSESFPSGHVMSGTTLYGFVLYLAYAIRSNFALRLAVAATSGALVLLTGPVNLWLGVHWPLDVAGGYLWGAALVVAGVWFARDGPRLWP